MAGETGGTTDRTLNKLQYALANKAVDITTVATGDLFLVADVSDDYEIKYATSAQIQAQSASVAVTNATTYTVLAANSGKTHIIPDLTSDITITLPAAAAGLEYTFICSAVAADAQDWIIDTGSATNYYVGGLQFLDTDEPAGTVLTSVFPDGNSNDIMTILTPGAGTRVHLVCDGTLWVVNGIVASATVPTFADT